MPGKFFAPEPLAHVCEGMGSPYAYASGTQFHCDECPKKWVVVEGAQYNEPYKAWRPLTWKNRTGRDI